MTEREISKWEVSLKVGCLKSLPNAVGKQPFIPRKSWEKIDVKMMMMKILKVNIVRWQSWKKGRFMEKQTHFLCQSSMLESRWHDEVYANLYRTYKANKKPVRFDIRVDSTVQDSHISHVSLRALVLTLAEYVKNVEYYFHPRLTRWYPSRIQFKMVGSCCPTQDQSWW